MIGRLRYAGWKIVGAIALMVALIAGGFAFGALTVKFHTWPYSAMLSAFRAVRAPSHPSAKLIRAKFFDFDVVTFAREGNSRSKEYLAGAFSRYGDDLLLLVGDGSFYYLDVNRHTSRQLDIQAPPNGAAALMAIPFESGEPTYKTGRWHRYIDIEVADGHLYLSYSHYSERDKCITLRIARLALSAPALDISATADDWDVIFETSPCFGFKSDRHPYAGNQAGGHMAISPDGYLYVAVGDYQFDGYGVANFPQDPNASYGKVWRIDLKTRVAQVFTVGHRNPQGIVRTPNGQIWESEHGPDGGDELNFLIPGENYGWPYALYGTEYGQRQWPLAKRQGRHEGYRQPAWAWMRSVATASIDYVDGIHPTWNGDLLIGTLADQALYRMVIEGERVVTFERIGVGERIRDLIVHKGRIFLYTDLDEVLMLSPRFPENSGRAEGLAASLSPSTSAQLHRCLECHRRDEAVTAPVLCGVLGRPVGKSAFGGYSPALSSFNGRWDKRLMMQFLENADGAIPGTTMPNPNISDPHIRSAIIDNLDFFCE
jgi:aldose sugar dehydrogenase